MRKRRTYLDACVLIAAWSGDTQSRSWARAVLDDPRRQFVVSDFVHLDVLPKPVFYRRSLELAFMRAILVNTEHVATSSALLQRALDMAGRFDVNLLDAIHLAAAALSGVDEMVTFGGAEKPMCRQTEVRVISLRALSQQDQP